jgi:hypothetical protein
MSRRVMVGGCAVVGLCVSVGAAFAPWVRVGTRTRSSFQMTGLIARLGIAGWQGMALRAWPVAPLLAAVAIALVVVGRDRLSGVVGTAVALVAIAAGLAACMIPDQTQTGPKLAIVGGFLALAGYVGLLVGPHRSPAGRERT